MFQEHKTVALLANKGDAAREILDRIKIAYEALPQWMQQGVVEWNKGSVQFENGCKIIAAATSSTAAWRRGTGASAAWGFSDRKCAPQRRHTAHCRHNHNDVVTAN